MTNTQNPTTLETIMMEAAAANPAAAAVEPEPARLTVAGAFIHYARLAASIERARTITANLPECTRDQTLTDSLKELVQTLQDATKAAQRLIEGNR